MSRRKLRIKAIQHMKNIIKGKRYVVADLTSGFILYDQNDYDKVVEGLGFITPVAIAKFRTYKKASEYLREKSKEESMFSSMDDGEWGIDPWGDVSWGQ